jgi:flagellar biosynthetic protein FliR
VEEWPAILEHVPPALLVVFRLGGLMIFGPVFGSPAVPVRVKVLLSFAIGLAVYPLLAARGLVGPGLDLGLWTLAPLVGSELLVGVVVGLLASLPLVSVQTGGLIMGQQMGLGFARFYNPGIDDEADLLGQVLFFLALAGFLLVGGHESMVLAILRSFEYLPLGAFHLDLDVVSLLAGLLLSVLELALRVAAPVLALVFLESVAMGFMAKTVPQLNILSLGFPLRILAGIAIVALGLWVIDDVVMDEIAWVLDGIHAWVGSR